VQAVAEIQVQIRLHELHPSPRQRERLTSFPGRNRHSHGSWVAWRSGCGSARSGWLAAGSGVFEGSGDSEEPVLLHALGEGRQVTSTAARPSSINTSGTGHHQCSQRAARPWPLSRPAQKTPTSRRTAPTTWPARRMA
jgi:hypothetical protein